MDSGETFDSFILRDDSGECVIDPEHAEIITGHYDQWCEDNQRFTEWKLLENDLLHVIGQFRTRGGNSTEFNLHEEMGALLAEWKRDMPTLLARFDLNQDGELDLNEWSLVRQAARREVERMMREAKAQPDIHTISQPPNGQFYLISNLTQQRLSRRYLLWAWGHLVIFFGSLGGFGWVLQHFHP